MHARGTHRLALLLALAAGVSGGGAARGDERGGLAPPAPAAAPPADLAALLDRALTPAQRGQRAFMEHLGWRFVVDPTVSKITYASGTPCQRRDLAEAQAAGDLRVLFPPGATAEDVAAFAVTLADVAESVTSRCAWQFVVAPAVERATGKLAENAVRGAWTFPQWLVVNAHVFSMTPPKSEWVRRTNILYFAREKPSAAVTSFYTERASTECYVAQTVAAYAVQYEIYGAQWFDEVFKAEEIAIGQVGPYHETPLGKAMNAPEGYPWRGLFLRPSDAGQDPGLVLARLGPLAFPGLTGFLMDQNGSGRSNQNFTFVSVSPAATDSLLRHGGFPYIAQGTQEFFTLEKAKRGKFVTGADLTRWQARIDEILSDPVFTGIRIYIHPYPVMTLGKMVDRLTRMDRTAVAVTFYNEAREDVFFQRYRGVWIDRWTQGAGRR